MRHPLVIGNWKLNGNRQMVNELISTLRGQLAPVTGCDVAIAPPALYLDLAGQCIAGSTILLAAQDTGVNLCGAFTGETSAAMLKDTGVNYVIIGHSERRNYHQETDELISQKFAISKQQGLIPVLCIGETEAENAAGQTQAVCARQIDAVINALGVSALTDSVIAYEPVWAIGTGKSASPLQAQTIHQFIRQHISRIDASVAARLIIQYGGSVTAANAAELFAQPDIDGALVGGASLKGDAFSAIVKAAAAAKCG